MWYDCLIDTGLEQSRRAATTDLISIKRRICGRIVPTLRFPTDRQTALAPSRCRVRRDAWLAASSGDIVVASGFCNAYHHIFC